MIDSRSVPAGGLAALLFGGVALVATWGPVVAEEVDTTGQLTVDDRAVRGRFEEALEKFRQSTEVPRASALIERLRELDRSGGGCIEAPKPAVEQETPPVLTSAEVYREALRGTLVVGNLYQCGKCSRWHASMAGGVMIDPSGILVTNFHVIDSDRAEVFGAMTAEGGTFPIVEVLAASRSDDLAIVRVDTDRDLPAVLLAEGNEPVGSEVRVVSHPDGRFYTFSEGVAARYFLEPKKRAPRLQITADYARGSSGCGVFNQAGALVGIVSSTDSIYYTEEGKVQENLQMVVKSCIPLASLRRLIGKPSEEPGARP